MLLKEFNRERFGELLRVGGLVVRRHLFVRVERDRIVPEELRAAELDDRLDDLLGVRVGLLTLVDDRGRLHQGEVPFLRVDEVDGEALRLVGDRLVAKPEAHGDLTRADLLQGARARLFQVGARVLFDLTDDGGARLLTLFGDHRLRHEPGGRAPHDVGDRDVAGVGRVGEVLDRGRRLEAVVFEHLRVDEEGAREPEDRRVVVGRRVDRLDLPFEREEHRLLLLEAL